MSHTSCPGTVPRRILAPQGLTTLRQHPRPQRPCTRPSWIAGRTSSSSAWTPTPTSCRSSAEGTAPPSGREPAAAALAPGLSAPPKHLLRLSSGVFLIPHPQKVEKGGEDWYFIAESQRALGVADGVGGWAGIGIDAGAYARMLMQYACEAADAQACGVSSCSDRDEYEALMLSGQEMEPPIRLSAQEILDTAYSRTDVKGSSTACIAVLNGNSLQITNLGDSGVLLMRGTQGLVMATQQQQHSFNFPFQCGGDGKGDQPHQAERYEVEVDCGDVIILATDGLWDNCSNKEIVTVMRECLKSGLSASDSAKTLGLHAQRRSLDVTYASPFALTARRAGINFMGGKVDDITVLVAYVESSGAAAAPTLDPLGSGDVDS